MRVPWPTVVVASVLVATGATTVAIAQPYQVVEIDPSLLVEDVNNQLQVVARNRVGLDTIPDTAFLWSPSAGIRSLSHIRSPYSLRINDAGLIGGTRYLEPPPTRGTRLRLAAFLTTADGSWYEEAELPLHTAPRAVRLTNSGILLMVTRSFENGRDVERHRALYRGVLYNLNELFAIAPPAAISDIDDAGTVVGRDALGSTFIRTLAGQLAAPWPEFAWTSLVSIGRGGHVAWYGLGAGGVTVNTRTPDGAVTRVPFPRSTSSGFETLSVNRHGVVVGGYSRFDSGLNARVDALSFLLQGDALTDLNLVMNLPGEELNAERITDGGVILAAARNRGWELVSRWVLLIPSVPAPPPAVRFAVFGRTVSLSWDPSTTAVEYIVEAGSAPGRSDFFDASVGGQLSIAGGVPPGRYYVRVRARNGAGVSSPSAEVVIDVP